MEASTPYFEITFWLVQNRRSICAYPADDVRDAISEPAELVMSSFHQFVQQALKSSVTIEQRGNSSCIWLRRISKFVQKTLNPS